MNHPIHTVLFDFDGTLAPNLDLPDMRRQVIELTRSVGVPDDAWAGRYIVEIIAASRDWLADRQHPAAAGYYRDAHQLITDIELNAARETAVFPWVPDLLRSLRAQGIRSSIVTRNCEAAVRLTFPDVDDLIDGLFARDNVEHLKPDARHFVTAMARTAAIGRNTCVVSDGTMDMRTGRDTGLYCIGVLTGSSNGMQLIEAGAHHVLPDARRVMDLFRA